LKTAHHHRLGLINDPDMNGTHRFQTGIARNLLCTINEMGLPVATEMLDPITPEYLADRFVGERSAPAPPNPRHTAKWPAAFPFR
jgi:phospho-2-dehydro-3-deoxyheptonate aldolase